MANRTCAKPSAHEVMAFYVSTITSHIKIKEAQAVQCQIALKKM